MKESRLKEISTEMGPLKEFCKEKGLDRKKFDFEEKIDEENKEFEKELKEISQERKLAKSKKKRLETFRKCRRRLEDLVGNWKETKDK